ncbi:hypothetical protein SUGI_0922000 [Cryptomeria japonica]|nr:hypothetical protein SUGI_0922000 [Cryptomeria japonica]
MTTPQPAQVAGIETEAVPVPEAPQYFFFASSNSKGEIDANYYIKRITFLQRLVGRLDRNRAFHLAIKFFPSITLKRLSIALHIYASVLPADCHLAAILIYLIYPNFSQIIKEDFVV